MSSGERRQRSRSSCVGGRSGLHLKYVPFGDNAYDSATISLRGELCDSVVGAACSHRDMSTHAWPRATGVSLVKMQGGALEKH